jgi:hypothetical protein
MSSSRESSVVQAVTLGKVQESTLLAIDEYRWFQYWYILGFEGTAYSNWVGV